MAIRTRSPKPSEWAAKTNHTHIINDPFVKSFLETCDPPPDSFDEESGDFDSIQDFDSSIPNPIRHILVIDGGYTTVEVKKNFPSSQIAFFQFGAVMFRVKDLEALSEKSFIFPEDMRKLHNLQRFKLALPIRNLKTRAQESLTNSVRKAIYDFFMQDRDSSSFMETLKWFVFEEYRPSPLQSYTLGSDPNLEEAGSTIELHRTDISSKYTFSTKNGLVYLTDVFRLHEAIDDDQGAGGILGYVTRLIEQLILVHFIKTIMRIQPSLLSEFIFIVDGPLSFSGQTANMHKPMRDLCNFLYQNRNLYLVGIEKSGAFVEHAQQVCQSDNNDSVIGRGKYLLLSNRYIYKYIMPGNSDRMHYGSTSYYGGKVIFHSNDGQILVLTVPTPDKEAILAPKLSEYHNLNAVLTNVQKLRCAMYDDAIVPVALANKLVSLANHPSKVLLEKFALSSMASSSGA